MNDLVVIRLNISSEYAWHYTVYRNEYHALIALVAVSGILRLATLIRCLDMSQKKEKYKSYLIAQRQ